MDYFTLAVNSMIISNLVIQHQQMLRLHRYQDLDSSSMHKLFRAYFYVCFFFAVSSVDFHHFKIPSLPSSPMVSTDNMVCSICLIVISIVYIVSMHTSQPLDHTGRDSAPFYTEELERQLLLSTETFKSTDPIVHIISTPVSKKLKTSSSQSELGKEQQFQAAALRSKDISPIQSYGNALHQYPQQQHREMDQPSSSQLSSKGTSPSASRGRKFSAVKTPILATLLNGDNVLAAVATASSPSNSSSHWTMALPVLIAFFYIVSQCVYSISVVKTNVYTPYRPYYLSAFWNIVLGLVIGVTTLLADLSILGPSSSLMQLSQNQWINYTVGSLLIVQGITSLVYYVLLTRKRSAIYSSSMSVQVYNSMSSPSLHSVY